MKEYFITIAAPNFVLEDEATRLMQDCHAKLEKMSFEELDLFVYKSRMAWTLAMHQLMHRDQTDSMRREQLAISNARIEINAHIRDEININTKWMSDDE